MNINKAIEITKDCERCRRIAGHMADFPYSQHEMGDAMSALLAQFETLAAEATLANRRYAAANARYQKLAKKTGQAVDEVETT
jgi:uncharacterized protein YdbL (DUF1318 family)